MTRFALLTLGVATLPNCVTGHGSLLWPLPRGGIDRSLPEYADGNFPSGHYDCRCSNNTLPGQVCESAQSCLWFENGCTIGCPCSGNGTMSRVANYSACENPTTKPTNNDPRTRSLNLDAVAGSPEDVYQFYPWRAPGSAMTSDPCGVAGGSGVKQGNGGEYYETKFAKLGDFGTKVLPAQPNGVSWRAGELINASLFLKANHAGGWQYRLCPADQPLTEACFQANPIPFAGSTQTLLLADGTEQVVDATFVSEGTTPANSTWVRNPLPECCPSSGACEKKGLTCGSSLSTDCYDHQCGASTSLGKSTPAFPWPTTNPASPPSNTSPRITIVDSLQIPADLPPGDYVFAWRWDAEETAQVWAACADVSIV